MTKLFASQRFLAIYSAALTLMFAITVLCGFAEWKHQEKFNEITVERINIVEPDGTLRMVISNKSNFPGFILKGKETPHPDRKTAGMLFFNDEGTENGGLIFERKPRQAGQGHQLRASQFRTSTSKIKSSPSMLGRRMASALQSCGYWISPTIPSPRTLPPESIARLPKDQQEAARKSPQVLQ